MRIIIMTLLISLIALPIMAKSFDNSGMAARLMAVVSQEQVQGGGGEGSSAEVAMATELNAINVGAGQ